MSWHLMVIGQLGIALLGCCGAFGWYTLKLRRANTALFEELEALRGSADIGTEAVSDSHAPTQDTTDALEQPVEATAASGTEQQAATDIATTAIPATADSAASPSQEQPDATANNLDSGLKALLQQFTQDSRDMMERIDELEAQTRALIEAASDAQAASDQAPEADDQEPPLNSPDPATPQNAEALEPAESEEDTVDLPAASDG